jgi:hypothetical protein
MQAELELDGVGDATLGEWRQFSGFAFHLRRRLTPEEESRVGPVVDVRRTREGVKRLDAMQKYLPKGYREF